MKKFIFTILLTFSLSVCVFAETIQPSTDLLPDVEYVDAQSVLNEVSFIVIVPDLITQSTIAQSTITPFASITKDVSTSTITQSFRYKQSTINKIEIPLKNTTLTIALNSMRDKHNRC